MHVIQPLFLLQTLKIVLVVLVACFAAVNCQDCFTDGLTELALDLCHRHFIVSSHAYK